MEPTIDLLFPKPVYRVHNLLLDQIPTLDSAVHNIIDSANIKRTGSLNVNSTHNIDDQLFLNNSFKELADICMWFTKDFMKKMVYNQYTIDNCKFHKMWANISYQNDFLFPHNHGDCLISGVFYIKAPVGSTITFYDNLNKVRTESLEYNHMTYEEYSYPCTSGTMLLFKNEMLHGNKAQPEGEKIAVSFNIGL
jgi:uncharacterized protein (TIGR02466 family)